MKENISLIECPACKHRVSSMAKACPQCGHPIDNTSFAQKIKETVHDIPEKIIEREGHDPNYKKGGKTKMFSFIWIPFAIFVILLMPQLDVILPVLLFTAWMWWQLGKDVKE
jgi:uncharacterized membrane protein YvbJ